MFAFTQGCRAATFADSLNDGTVKVCVVDDEGRPIHDVYVNVASLSDMHSNLGLTDTMKDNMSDKKLKNNVIQVGVGYRF